jgi:YVTN family beta-propeller protein
MIRLAMPVFVLFLGAAPAAADLLIVLNKSDHQAALVDPADHRVITKLATGQGPHEVAVTPDGRWAFVANYGVSGVFGNGERRDEPGNTLTVLDLKSRKVARTIQLEGFSKPHGIQASKDGTRIWVTSEVAKSVLEVDVKSGRILRTWPTSQDISHMVVATPDEKKLYVANIGSGSVTIIDRKSGNVHSVTTAAGSEGIDVAPNGREVWVTNRGANSVSVIDVASDSVVATFESGGEFPIRAKFTPDGKQVFVSNARSNEVVVFDAATRAPVGKVAVGVMPVGIQMEPSGRRAYVANTNDDKVTVIDVATRAVVTTFAPGKEPDGMGWARK